MILRRRGLARGQVGVSIAWVADAEAAPETNVGIQSVDAIGLHPLISAAAQYPAIRR